MDSTPTRTAGWTGTVRALMLASTPATVGVTTVPAVNTTSPVRTSLPAGRTASPGAAVARTRTRLPSSRRSVRSTITTASAPAGIGAPVMSRTASPGRSGTAGAAATRRDLRHNRQLDRGRADVGGAHRVPVDGAVGERRHILASHHVGGEHQTERGGAIHVDGRERRARAEHRALRLREGDHPVQCIGVTDLRSFSADGHRVQWASAGDGNGHGRRGFVESFTLEWENEAWTASGRVGRENVQYVIRVAPTWHVRQFMLFRDLDQPDLWLAIDAHHHWGEVNGSYRRELDGCADVELSCTPFTATLPIRRLGLGVGEGADLPVVAVDVETLAAAVVRVRYERTASRSWRRTRLADGHVREFTVDDHGLVIDEPGRFVRLPG